jgi:hypothetical protein
MAVRIEGMSKRSFPLLPPSGRRGQGEEGHAAALSAGETHLSPTLSALKGGEGEEAKLGN